MIAYSCGLLLWTIMLDGKAPWNLEMFSGTPDISFERQKQNPQGLVDIAVATAAASCELSDKEMDKLFTLFGSLLCRWQDRSLGSLLRDSDWYVPGLVIIQRN